MSNNSWKISCGGSSASCLISSASPDGKDLTKAKPDSPGLYLKPSALCPVPRGNNLTPVFCFSSGTSTLENGYTHSILSSQNTPEGNYCLIPALCFSPSSGHELEAWRSSSVHPISTSPSPLTAYCSWPEAFLGSPKFPSSFAFCCLARPVLQCYRNSGMSCQEQ